MKFLIPILGSLSGAIGMTKVYRAYNHLSEEDRVFLTSHPEIKGEYDQERLSNSVVLGAVSAFTFPVSLPYFGVRGLSELLQHPIHTGTSISMGSKFILEKKEDESQFQCRLNPRLKMN